MAKNSKNYLYPDITPQTLRLIEVMRQLAKDNPDYWDYAPYDGQVARYFRSWFDKPIAESSETKNHPLTGENKWEVLYQETVELYQQMKNAKPSAADAAESMSYFRTMVSLTDKLVSHQERAVNVKQVHEFHSTVLDILTNVLTDSQRNDVMEKLRNVIKAD